MEENETQNNSLEKEENTSKQNINILVETSQDKIEAYITIIPISDTPKIDSAEIKNVLAEKGIKFGVREDLFEDDREKIIEVSDCYVENLSDFEVMPNEEGFDHCRF